MNQPPIIALENVSRDFPVAGQTIHALRDLSFSVQPGDFVAIIGRSGSGKTTLLNVIAGLDKPTAGRVLVDGQDVATMNEKQLTELRRNKLGFVFQSFGLLPLLSAYENVEIALRIAGAGIRERGRRAAEVLEMVGLTRRAHHRPYELSGGEQQRVAIARALANRPAIILADEPTGELDSATAASIFSLLLEVVARENVTVITTTHDRLVMERAKRVIELFDGALVTAPSVLAHAMEEKRSPTYIPPPVTTPSPAVASNRPEPHTPDLGDYRWARPARPTPQIYQPPGPPREPL
jgi:putative ABC transport system ATP-binding protein